ncbi:Glycosyl transferase family 2 [Aliiroseovarius crassostreae]|nr:Glycosyl transferase family 2 [Aliiroseovarius crassostreae]
MPITAVACVKSEDPFLIEWIAFNSVLGVTDFLFYSNDCTDATNRLLDALAARGIVTHLPNPAEGRNYQMEALKAAKSHDLVLSSDWIWIADVDEFLNIHVGQGTIPELIDACDNPHAISVTLQFFANCERAESHQSGPAEIRHHHIGSGAETGRDECCGLAHPARAEQGGSPGPHLCRQADV